MCDSGADIKGLVYWRRNLGRRLFRRLRMRAFFCSLLGRCGLVEEEEEGKRRGGERNFIPPRLLLWGMMDRERRGSIR